MSEPSNTEGTVARKEMILAAAAEIIAERGFARTTVRDIGKRIGLLSGSLYHYFDSKESIADEMLNRFWVSILQQYKEVVAAGNPARETLTQLIQIAHKATSEHTAEIQLLTSDWRELAKFESFNEIRKSGTKVSDIWVGVMRAGVEAGDFRGDVDLSITYRTIMGSIQSLNSWYDPTGPLTVEEIASVQAKLFIDALVAEQS